MCLPRLTLTAASWERRIRDAVAEPGPARCNRQITRCHHDLSLALRAALGVEAGANFHSWAVWGSHKAGATIRGEDVRAVARLGAALFGVLGLLGGLAAGCCLGGALAAVTLALIGGVGGAALATLVIRRAGAAAPRLVLHGNRIVLEDIGAATARFLACLDVPGPAEAVRVARFLATLRPGRTADGGQDLLREAFRYYYEARRADHVGSKREAAYLANCLAILHEHIRLQPCIADAMPRPLRRWVTRRLLTFRVGPRQFRVCEDVAAGHLGAALGSLKQPEAAEYLVGPCAGRAARDWTRLAERMRYVTGLFGAFHLAPEVFARPAG